MQPSKRSNPERDLGPSGIARERVGALRSLARGLWPFWLFKDATRGDVYARAAARQHNRRMCDSLPRYIFKWFLVCCVASTGIFACDTLAGDVGRRLDVFVIMAAGSGIVCAYALCVLLVIGYAYLYLRHGEH